MLLLLACADPDKPPIDTDSGETDTDTDTGTGTIVDCVESAGAKVDESAYAWQAWDNGTGAASMYDFRGRTSATTEVFNLWSEPGWEGVRFEFADPGTIHALKVWYAAFSEDGDTTEPVPVTLGLYTDFGHNGFDFHPDAPLWTGTRCLSDLDAGDWVTFAVDPPVEVGPTTLVYAANYRNGRDGPMLAMDGDAAGDGTCATWDECHSSLNYPEVDDTIYYNGLSFVLQYDFMINAQIETTAEAPAPWFNVDPALYIGARAAWGDFDDDGDDDMMAPGPALYENEGGVFNDVSTDAGVNTSGLSIGGGVWGDFDNDGCLDFFGMNEGRALDATGGELLLRNNCDGTFSDVTLLSGIDDSQAAVDCLTEGVPQHSPTAGAGWVDFDNDGLIDLVQANFLCFDDYTNYPDRFWHNEGGGVFSDWSGTNGFVMDDLGGRGVAPIDADLDGDIDITINNYVLHPNLYYQNDGGTFTEAGVATGLSGHGTDYGGLLYGHTIGTAWGDLDDDGDWDAVHANLAHPRFYHFSDRTNLLIQDGGTWTNEADTRGIQYHETHSSPTLLDFENDGDLDLTITEVYDGRPVDVYTNDGDANFTPAAWEAGITVESGWGAAAADYDNDGDQDLVAYSLFRNDVATGHWLKLRLEGDVDSNRAAIGAIAWVTAGGVTRMRSVNGGTGTGCQDSLTLHFGLGETTVVDTVEVWFPGGATVTFTDVAADAGYRVTESGVIRAGLGAEP